MSQNIIRTFANVNNVLIRIFTQVVRIDPKCGIYSLVRFPPPSTTRSDFVDNVAFVA
jgi:hypothetical protein